MKAPCQFTSQCWRGADRRQNGAWDSHQHPKDLLLSCGIPLQADGLEAGPNPGAPKPGMADAGTSLPTREHPCFYEQTAQPQPGHGQTHSFSHTTTIQLSWSPGSNSQSLSSATQKKAALQHKCSKSQSWPSDHHTHLQGFCLKFNLQP